MRDTSRLGPVDRIGDAWIHWESCPTSRPACVDRLDAVSALGLSSGAVHERIAAARRAGWDVPSAVERAVLDLTPTNLEEVS